MTTKTASVKIRAIHEGCSRRESMERRNMRLQAQIAALIEDNKQLRAALRIYSEVARQSPATLPLEQVA